MERGEEALTTQRMTNATTSAMLMTPNPKKNTASTGASLMLDRWPNVVFAGAASALAMKPPMRPVNSKQWSTVQTTKS